MSYKSIVLLVSCIVNYSFAFTPVEPLSLIQKLNQQSTLVSKKTENDFTNFSGMWKGKCIFENSEIEETVIIKNTANYIKFGSKKFLIGTGLYSESNTSSQETYFDHKEFNWSKDLKTLNMQATKVVGANLNKSLTTYIFTNRISLVQDHILISIKVKGFQNMELIGEDKGNCVYGRV
jgi:hypothetical protein